MTQMLTSRDSTPACRCALGVTQFGGRTAATASCVMFDARIEAEIAHFSTPAVAWAAAHATNRLEVQA
ncbi:hypothetical protein [Sulfitobacter sp. 1A12157]|uniref:hypothetical protein n=1 Tax=Sulfitobacter sp. 1A12157 TaxID=3368594 RepID=UPI0037464F93